MEIIAALFVENFDIRTTPEGPARIDLGGVYFSTAATGPFPATVTPHLVVLVRCPSDHSGTGLLEVVFRRGDDEVARNRQFVNVEPGKFGYNLVQAELEFSEPGTVQAECRIDQGETTRVPLTMVPAGQ